MRGLWADSRSRPAEGRWRSKEADSRPRCARSFCAGGAPPDQPRTRAGRPRPRPPMRARRSPARQRHRNTSAAHTTAATKRPPRIVRATRKRRPTYSEQVERGAAAEASAGIDVELVADVCERRLHREREEDDACHHRQMQVGVDIARERGALRRRFGRSAAAGRGSGRSRSTPARTTSRPRTRAPRRRSRLC